VGEEYSDLEFEQCRFISCDFGMNRAMPSGRSILRRVRLDRCSTVGSSSVGAVVLEDVDVHALKTGAPLIVFGAVYKHVRFTGACGSFVLSPFVDVGDDPEDLARDSAYRLANAAYYRTVDWALDISAAEFDGMSVRGGAPAHLVRRDPETQMVARRSVVEETQATWRRLKLPGTPWRNIFELMLTRHVDDSFVLVAPKRSKHFKAWLAGLKTLRCEGILDPD
jgi:hypothetical protein